MAPRRAPRPAGRSVLVAAVLLAVLAAACGSDPAPSAVGDAAAAPGPTAASATGEPATPGAPADPGSTTTGDSAPPTTAGGPVGPQPVAQLTLDLVDPGRPTPAGAASPAREDRALPTRVWYPDAPGPWPVIVFAHGLNGHPDKFSQLLADWAQAGYVVAAPRFPLTSNETPQAPSNFFDVADQPADLSFVLDQVLAAGEDPESPLRGLVDPERIGVGGLSLGGATTYLAGLNDASRDPRFSAAMVLDGVAGNDPATGTFLEPSGVPAFLAHCAVDPAADLSIAQRAYDALAAPRYLVVLDGLCHAEAFEDTPHPLDDLAAPTTIAFWDTWLAGRQEPERLAEVLDGDARIDWQADLG